MTSGNAAEMERMTMTKQNTTANRKTATTTAANNAHNAAALYAQAYEAMENAATLYNKTPNPYNRTKYDEAAANLKAAEKAMHNAAAKVDGKVVPITAANLYDRAAMIAFVALRTAEMGSRIKRNADGETVGGGNTGAGRHIMQTKAACRYAMTNAVDPSILQFAATTDNAAIPYLSRTANDFDDIRQEVAVALYEAMADEASQEEMYAAGFHAANAWIWAWKSRPAAKHLYIDTFDEETNGFDIVDITADYAHMVNHIEEYEALAAIKAALTEKQWTALVFVGKGYPDKTAAAIMGVSVAAYRDYLFRGRKAAARLFPNLADLPDYDTAAAVAHLIAVR